MILNRKKTQVKFSSIKKMPKIKISTCNNDHCLIELGEYTIYYVYLYSFLHVNLTN